MANYSVLKAAVQAVVKTNGNQEITGANMQSTLISIINSLGTGYQFMGVATPSTSPGTPDQREFYITGQAGTYTNFNNLVVTGIAVLYYDTAWHVTNVAPIDEIPTASSNNLVKSGGVCELTGITYNAVEGGGSNIVKGYTIPNVTLNNGDYVAVYLSGSVTFAGGTDAFIQVQLLEGTSQLYKNLYALPVDKTFSPIVIYDKVTRDNSHIHVRGTWLTSETLNVKVIKGEIGVLYEKTYLISSNLIYANPLINQGGYLRVSDGNLIYNPSVYPMFAFSEYLPLKFFDKFALSNILNRTDMAYASVYDSDKNFLLSYVYSSSNDVTINVSDIISSYENAFYIRFCGGSPQGYGKDRTTIVNPVFSSYDYLADFLKSTTDYGHIFDKINSEIIYYERFNNIIRQDVVTINAAKGYQDATGVIRGDGTDGSWFHTDFIPVKFGDSIVCMNLGGQGTAVMTVGFFNAAKQCLVSDSYKNVIGSEPVTFVIENSDISFVRFSGNYARWFGPNQGAITMSLQVPVNKKLEQIDNDIASINDELDEIREVLPVPSQGDSVGIISDIEHIICYGQSLSQGDWEQHIVTYTQKYNSLMFTGTIRVWEYRDQAHKYDALIPAVETLFRYQSGETPVGATVRGETPCCGTGEKAMELLINEGFNINEYQYQILLSAPGMGGYAISALSKGTAVYNRLLADVQAGKNLANASGKSFVCRGVSWIQGESDNGASFDYYYNAMNNLFDDLNNDIRTITGQSERVHFFLYQMRCYDWYFTGFKWPNVPLAQLEICKNRDDCHMVGPIYQMPLIADYTHFTAEGSKWYGGYIGKVWKKVLLDGERWMGGIYLKKYEVAGNSITLQFNVPNPPLTFDTINVPDRGVSKGFQIRNTDDFEQNSYLNIITNVEIVRPDTVRITCSQSPAGKRLTYAINGTATPSDRADMGSGNLRDSCTDVFNFPIEENGSDVEHKLYNWCPLFDQIL